MNDGHLAAAGVSDEAGEGARQLRCILTADCDDYQRGLWYAVSRCPSDIATEHLAWPVEITRARASMFPAIRGSGALLPMLPQGAYDEGSAQLRASQLSGG